MLKYLGGIRDQSPKLNFKIVHMISNKTLYLLSVNGARKESWFYKVKGGNYLESLWLASVLLR